ncbi:PREDICTED: collagenase-like [Papilio polytes]|uniref:collagenase-like n=1 Tax=Papilio polytes TaxID=76194 RepID=UPI0006765058|nr:PREDICTED: collagenase-like [Papilio polytes]
MWSKDAPKCPGIETPYIISMTGIHISVVHNFNKRRQTDGENTEGVNDGHGHPQYQTLVAVNCNVLVAETEANGVYNYLGTIGIEEAERIKQLEYNLPGSVQRIVGGFDVVSAVVPYQAGLIIDLSLERQAICGGVIIAFNRILTAAHCNDDGVNTAESITVVVGSEYIFIGGVRETVLSAVMHPEYDPKTIANDVAVLRIPGLRFVYNIQPVSLPTGNELNQTYEGVYGRASGFGIRRDGGSMQLYQSLHMAILRVISNAECRSVYGDVVQDSHVCTSGAGRIGICKGDTGGPLVGTLISTVIFQIGIGSFTSSRGCQAGAPSGFTRITSFVPWIMSV